MKTASIVSVAPKILSWPILYTKKGCLGCAEARAMLDRHGTCYHERSMTADAFAEAQRLSGQSKAPVLDWSAEILADFGAGELESFLATIVCSGMVQLPASLP